MSLSIDPKFQAWYNKRKIAQRTGTDIPTRNANPTLPAGPKNSNGKQSGKVRDTIKTATKKSVGKPKGKYRAKN